MDECSDGTAICDLNANCTNTIGSYTCSCNSGFTGDGTNCSGKQKCHMEISLRNMQTY